MKIYISNKNLKPITQEFVERKGIGHPDTLSDALAEELSINYSNYTKNKYGAVLHHNFDKVGLLGGASFVTFGKGYLTKPIRVLINGRASTKFGGEEIPVRDLLINWANEFMKKRFPMIDETKDLEFHYNLSNQSSPGKTEERTSETGTRKYWFEPRDIDDLQELKKLLSNDTSLGVGYAPYTVLEKLILSIEGHLNSESFRSKNPWIGSDIKIMGFRSEDEFHITMCIPQIANHVLNVTEYRNNLELCRNVIRKIVEDSNVQQLELNINTRDNFETSEFYLTATGSSIESGDEGLVGRGNRINGVISPSRPMSMEGACGKNPVYHIGKVYYLAANELSKKIYDKFGVENEVYLVSQSGRDLLDPWMVNVQVAGSFSNFAELQNLILEEMKQIPKITERLLNREYTLY